MNVYLYWCLLLPSLFLNGGPELPVHWWELIKSERIAINKSLRGKRLNSLVRKWISSKRLPSLLEVSIMSSEKLSLLSLHYQLDHGVFIFFNFSLGLLTTPTRKNRTAIYGKLHFDLAELFLILEFDELAVRA